MGRYAGPAMQIDGLTKTFGSGSSTVNAVDNLSFSVRPGAVTGFLGPNGAGKTTTLRMLLGLISATSGQALIDGRPYAERRQPAREVGAALEASGFHPGRSGLAHLLVCAPGVGATKERAREVLELVGLSADGGRRVGAYSMGMRQRLGLATALLGDPPAVVLDEPANGLDPQGIVWMRSLLRHFASEGRTVLVSSHVLAEVQSTVDDVVIIAGGRLVHASSLAELAAMTEVSTTVTSPNQEGLLDLCHREGWAARAEGGTVQLLGVPAPVVGAAAFAAGLELHQLRTEETNLESVFLRLTQPPDASELFVDQTRESV